MKKRLISAFLSLCFLLSVFADVAMAEKLMRENASALATKTTVSTETAEQPEVTDADVAAETTNRDVTQVETRTPSQEVCGFTVPEEKIYDSKIITVRRKLRVQEGETFKVKVFVKNTGNMPWFASDSTCLGPKVNLGTDKTRDRTSVFYSNVEEEGNNWISPSRVKMDQERTDPGEIASFTFYSLAGQEPDVYKEYMTPVAEDITWMDSGTFFFDVIVGSPDEPLTDLRKKITYANASGSVLDINLNGERSILVDLSDQMGYLTLDGVTIREFQVSTGASATPTPTGETSIMLKQEVRVGGKSPHYIMPNFIMFRAGGYGLHSLPSLGSDGGIFWTEARSHIGIPVSHGCVRMLPEDSDFAFEFLQLGDTVTVQY